MTSCKVNNKRIKSLLHSESRQILSRYYIPNRNKFNARLTSKRVVMDLSSAMIIAGMSPLRFAVASMVVADFLRLGRTDLRAACHFFLALLRTFAPGSEGSFSVSMVSRSSSSSSLLLFESRRCKFVQRLINQFIPE